MASPFPGMDPYLEDPAIWSGVHAALLAALFERLGPAVRPKYAVRYEERVYISGEEDPGRRMIVPDVRVVQRSTLSRRDYASASGTLVIDEPIKLSQPVEEEVHERRLQILDVRDRSLVTVIELISPSNKVVGSAGRESFLQKRREVFASNAHWMEIDLLHEGERAFRSAELAPTEYQVYLSRAGKPRQAYAWPIPIQVPLPVIAIPLRGDDADVPLDLQSALADVIARGSYDLDADYSREPTPPLKGELSEWARTTLA